MPRSWNIFCSQLSPGPQLCTFAMDPQCPAAGLLCLKKKTSDRRSHLQAVHFPEETIVKKCLSLVLVLMLALAAPAMAAGEADAQAKPVPQNRIEQLTGKAWLASSQEAKVALLFGIELALNVEKFGADMANARMAQNPKGKKLPPIKLSPFAEAWYKSFANVHLTDIAAQIDAWYAANPGSEDTLVLAVIWRDLMKMPMDGKKK